MKKVVLTFVLVVPFTIGAAAVAHPEENNPTRTDDPDLTADLKLLQGSWEQTFGNNGTPVRVVKTIEGNTETRRSYEIKTGKIRVETVADFTLSKSGAARVFTFHFKDAPDDEKYSYIYSVDASSFYDVPGVLHGEYRNYMVSPNVIRWKRVTDDGELATDLNLIQGPWETKFGNDGTGKPTVRVVKMIEGNMETRREYDLKTGKLRGETAADFKLSKSGGIRVFTFHYKGTPESESFSYIYHVDEKTFDEVPGLLHGLFRNYQPSPKLIRWKRISNEEAEKLKTGKDSSGESEKKQSK